MNTHRPSSIRTYRRCPHRAWHQYYKPGERTYFAETPENFLTGIAFHDYAARALTNKIPGFNHDGRYSAAMELECAALWNRASDLVPSGTLLTVETPIRIGYGDTDHEGTLAGTPDAEFEPDDTTGVITIVDWKTSWGPMGYEDEQFLDYAALRAWTDSTVERIRRHTVFVRTGYVKKDEIPRESAEDHLKIMIRRCTDIDEHDLHDGDNWPAQPGPICDDCPAAPACPVTEDERKAAGAINSEAEAMDLTEWILATEARIREHKKHLKVWCGQAGPVPLEGGYQYGFRQIEKRSFDMTALAGILTKDQLAAAARIDTKEFDKLAKSDPDLYMTIAAAMELIQETRFERHKADPE